MTDRPDTLHVEDLIGSRVEEANGRLLGHIADVVVKPEAGYRITALELGRIGWIDRFDLVRALGRFVEGHGKPCIVAWTDVSRFDHGTVTLKPGRSARECDDDE